MVDDAAVAAEEAAARAGAANDDDDDEVAAAATSLAPLYSEEIVQDALVESAIELVPYLHYQFERLGYFVSDKDTDANKDKLVLNRSTGLKESKGKKSLK